VALSVVAVAAALELLVVVAAAKCRMVAAVVPLVVMGALG
jgi:hypothetical protein